jgi:hypothetical protein
VLADNLAELIADPWAHTPDDDYGQLSNEALH